MKTLCLQIVCVVLVIGMTIIGCSQESKSPTSPAVEDIQSTLPDESNSKLATDIPADSKVNLESSATPAPDILNNPEISVDSSNLKFPIEEYSDTNAKSAMSMRCYKPPAKKGDIWAVFMCNADNSGLCKDTQVTVTWGSWSKSGTVTGKKFPWWGVVFHLNHSKNDSYQLCVSTDGLWVSGPYQGGRPLEWFQPGLYKYLSW
jgi:hypothetical protein